MFKFDLPQCVTRMLANTFLGATTILGGSQVALGVEFELKQRGVIST